MRRLYFLADDLETTELVARCLSHQYQGDWRYHVIGLDQQGLLQHQIRTANLWQKTDVVRLAEQGALLGVIVGVIAAGFYAAFNPHVLPLPLITWLGSILAPALLFSWIGAMVGSRMLHYRIKQFSDDIHYGRYLVLVDSNKHQSEALRQFLLSRVPSLKAAGESSTHAIPFQAT